MTKRRGQEQRETSAGCAYAAAGLRIALLVLIAFMQLSVQSSVFAADGDRAPMPRVASPFASDGRYTAEGFAGLSDEEKRTVYFGRPQLLPEGFSAQAYIRLFHPEMQPEGGD